MSTYNEFQGFRINKMSKTIFDQEKKAGNIKSNEVYIVLRGNDPTGLPDYDTKPGYVLKVNSNGTDVEWQRDINNAAVFENLSAMADTLNNSSKTEYAIGQSVFIADQNVPDFWIYSIEDEYVIGNTPTDYTQQFYQFGYYKLSLLEIGKVIFNSNITYSETEPTDAKIGDIWLAPAEEIINELPEYTAADRGKLLQVNATGDLYWNKIAPVEANPELDGTEQDLNSVKIDGVLYEIKGGGGEGSVEMIFSDAPNSDGTPLRTITIGDDIWSIPLGGGEGGSVDLTGYATESYVNSQGFLKSEDLTAYEYATEDYVDTAVANLVDSAPDELNTLKELSTAIQSNKDILGTLEEAITKKQDRLISTVNIKTINGNSIIGPGNIDIETGSGVIVNPALSGIEEDINGLEIDGVKYAVPSTVMVLSDQNIESEDTYTLKSIAVGDYVWKIEGEKYDLTPYATINYVNTNIQAIANEKQNILSNSDFKTINGTSVFGSGEITIDIPSLEGYATENWVLNKNYLNSNTLSETLTDYALKTDIPVIEDFATTDYVDTKFDEILGGEGIPGALDTIKEIAEKIQGNADIITTLRDSVTNKADKSDTVNTSTSQTINGLKTFTSGIALTYDPISDISPAVNLKANNSYGSLSTSIVNGKRRLELMSYDSTNSQKRTKLILSEDKGIIEYSTDGITTKSGTIATSSNLVTINGKSLIGNENIDTVTNLDNYYNKEETIALIDSRIGVVFDTLDALIGG